MSNPLLDALGSVSYALDTPGAYLRGALSGKLGERASGREMLQNWGVAGEDQPGLDWGDIGGFGAEMVLDPLSLAGPALGAIKGIGAGTRAARAVAGLGEASPLARRLGELKAGVETPLDAVRHSYRQGESANPLARAMGNFAADEGGYLKYPTGLPPHLQPMADALGPMYSGGLDKLKTILGPDIPEYGALRSLQRQMQSTMPWDRRMLERLANEMPDRTTVLGHGSEGVAFKTPEGGVIRFGPRTSGSGPPDLVTPRPDIPHVLQPYRVAEMGDDYVAEHLPFATPLDAGFGIDEVARMNALRGAKNETRTAYERLNKADDVLGNTLDRPGFDIEKQISDRYPGANPWDLHAANMGVTREGKGLVLDPGAVGYDAIAMDQAPYPHHAYNPDFEKLTPEMINSLMEANAHIGVRRSLQQGATAGSPGQGVDLSPLWAKRLQVAMEKYAPLAKPYLGRWPESDVLNQFLGR